MQNRAIEKRITPARITHNTAFVYIDTKSISLYIYEKEEKEMRSKIKRHSRSVLSIILSISIEANGKISYCCSITVQLWTKLWIKQSARKS